MRYKATIIFLVAVSLLMLLASCKSATEQIAESSDEIRTHSAHIADLAKDSKRAAVASKSLFVVIGKEAESPNPDMGKIGEDAAAGAEHQDKIINNSDEINGRHIGIVGEVSEVTTALTGVQNITPWWGRMLTYGMIALSVIGIGFVLWYTGVGSFLRGVLGIVTPRARKEADIAVATLDTDDPTTMREFVAAKRGLDPEFDRAFRKAWTERREAAAHHHPQTTNAASETTEKQ